MEISFRSSNGHKDARPDQEDMCTNVYITHIFFAYFQIALFMQLSTNSAPLFIFVLRGNRRGFCLLGEARSKSPLPSPRGDPTKASHLSEDQNKPGAPRMDQNAPPMAPVGLIPPLLAPNGQTLCAPGKEACNNSRLSKKKSISHQIL